MIKSKSVFAKAVLIVIAVLLVTFAAAMPIIFNSAFSDVSFDSDALPDVAYALNSSGGTWLNSKGIQVGDNTLLTSADTEDGNASGSGAYSNARDFYVSGSSAYSYSATSLSMTNGTAQVILPLYNYLTNSSDSDLYGGVFYAIQDPLMKVDFNMNGSLTNNSTDDITVTVIIRWYSSSSTTVTGQSSQSYTLLYGDSDVSLASSALQNISTTNISNGARFAIIFQSTGSFAIASPSVEIAVDSGDNIHIGEQATYALTGANRVAVGPISNVTGSETTYYVKSGDTITLKVKAYSGSSMDLYLFPSYYNAIFGIEGNGASGVYWEAYTIDPANPTVRDTETTYLSKVPNSDKVSSDGQWYEVQYTITDGAGNVDNIYLQPMIYTYRDASGATSNSYLSSFKFYVDDDEPNAPTIDPSSTLGQAIANKTWYTESSTNSPKITFSEATHTVLANESIYGFVVPSNTISASGLADYDYTPGNGATLSYGTSSYANRQELVSYNTSGQRVTSNCTFDKSGEWGLILVSVDAAGNVSDAVYYNYYNYNSLFIDGTKYPVGTNFLLGSSVVTNASTIGTVYVIAGNSYHDEDGNLKPADYHLMSQFKKTTMRDTVARLQWVTIRIAMTTIQYSKYQLVSYTNKSNISSTEINFVAPTETGRPYYIDLPSFQVTDEFVTNDQAGIVDCVFRSRVNLTLISATSENTVYRSYLGEPISVADSVEIYTLGGALLQGRKLTVNYYEIKEYLVYPNSNSVGGTIVFGGVNYTNTTQNLITKGQTININGKNYITISSTRNANKDGLTNYTIGCYEEGANKVDNQGYSLGYTDAGSYWYTAAIQEDDALYYGETSGMLVINKASPTLTDVTTNVLTYGMVDNYGNKGLDLLVFESLSQYGSRLIYVGADSASRTLFGTTYYDSYYGVLGMFTITNPTTLDEIYYNPTVTTTMKISVVFTPIVVAKGNTVNDFLIDDAYIEENFGVMNRYYEIDEDGNYVLKEGGLHGGNYAAQTLVLTVTVVHALVENDDITVESDTVVEYDGLEKSVVLSTSPADLPYLVYYKQKDAADSTYTTNKPFNAGDYTVKYYIDSSRCNYYSEETEIDFTIEKRTLNLKLTSATNISSTPYSYTYEGNNYLFTERVDANYGYFTRPALGASYVSNGVTMSLNVIYYIQYKMIRDYANNLTPYSEMTDPVPESEVDSASVDAGLYMVIVTVNNTNNQGTLVCLVKIAQAGTSGSNSLMISYPSLNSAYYAYSVKQETIISVGDDRTIGNIEYGQTISDMESSLILLTDNTIAQYLFRGNSARTTVNGRFVLEKESSILARYGMDMTYNAAGKLILPVLLDGENNNISAYTVYLYWEAGVYNEESGSFTPNNNFVLEKMEVTFYVVRATADFSDVNLSTLIYGDALVKAEFEGNPATYGGATLTGISKDGNSTEIVDLFSTTYAGKKVLVGYQDDGKIAYVLSYELPNITVFSKGTFNVECLFQPANEFAYSYHKIIGLTVPITIVARPATIDFVTDSDGNVTHNFGATYADPQVTTSPISNISVRFEFYTLNDVQFSLTSTTPVGEYKVKAIIDDENYAGTTEAPFFVVKSALYLSIQPTNAPQSYGVTLGDISLSPGRCFSIASVPIDGTFAFVNTDEVPEVGTATYLVRFTPYNTAAYNSYKVFEYQYSLTISKASVTIEYSNLVHTYDGYGKEPTLYAEDPNGNELPVNITYTNWTPTAYMQLPELAGSYSLNLEVNTEHYYRSVNVTLVINKAYAVIDTDAQYTKYTGAARTFVPVFDVDGLTYTLKYVNYYGTTVASPVDVGAYTVTVVINHTNYQGSATVMFYIEPNRYTVYNLAQVYNPYGNTAVTAAFLPEDIDYVTLYSSKDSTTPSDYSEAVPEDAGTYYVALHITQYGYDAYKYNMTVDGEDVRIMLVISPADAVIDAPEQFYRVYTSRAHKDLSCTVTPSVSTSYKYRALGSDDEFSATAPILAGYYDVLIEISDSNYTGSAITTLWIDKATPIIGTQPSIISTNSFNTSLTEVAFSATGSAIFTSTGAYITNNGHWEIDEEDEVFMLLPVGTHNVKLKFVPDDTDNFYDAKYYDTAATNRVTIDIIISKKDLGAYIGFNSDELYQKYQAKQLSVGAFLTDYSVLIDNYGELQIVVTYNGQQIRPRSVGNYTLSAYIIDDNYTGSAADTVFQIVKADVEVSAPTVAPIEIGQDLGTYSSLTGGYAYIPVTTGSVSATVDGTFEFTYPDTTYNRANYQKVKITFTPTDVVNHNIHVFDTSIFVLGTSVTVEGVAATGVVFGQPLSESEITYEYVSVSGSFAWANPNQILAKGELGTYIFTPDAHDVYNIVTGTVEVDVAEAAMSVDQTSLVAKVYVKSAEPYNTLADAIISMDLYHSDHLLDPAWLVSGAVISLSEENSNLAYEVKEAGIKLENILVEITHRDYAPLNIYVTVRTYYELTDANFQINSTSKIYDGNAVKISDLSANLAGTAYQLNAADYNMSITKNGVAVSEMVEAGVYNVALSVKTQTIANGVIEYANVAYDGVYNFVYTINKLDITDSVTVSGNTKVYGDYSTVVTAFFGEYEVNKNSVLIYYYSSDLATAYGVVAPQNAGNYKVVVEIANQNKQFTASATFNYVITKRQATVSLNSSYVTTYGTPFSIAPDISNNIGSENYSVTYGGSSTIPQNVGEYKVVFTINHTNFYGSGTTYLSIRQATLTLDELPTLSSIIYGQELYNSIVTGGKVVYGSSAIEISGVFEFETPNVNTLPAGSNYVSMLFNPDNSNYASILLEVPLLINKGLASIQLVSPTATYDGKDKAPQYITQPLNGLAVAMIFRQGNRIVDPVNAGEYRVTITIDDKNYEGTATFTFTILKAVPIYITAPTASNLSYGQSLEYSSLSGGSIIYIEGGKPVSGAFAYTQIGLQPGPVGVYNNVEYTFTPTDTANYDVYTGVVTVTVIKAVASIRVTGTDFIYGDRITDPVFTTDPANINVNNAQFVSSAMLGTVPHVGSYSFVAAIEDANYTGSVTYVISVSKKLLTVSFVNSNNAAVDRYATKYNSVVYAKAVIDQSSLVSQDLASINEISTYITYYYGLRNVDNAEFSHIPTTAVGEYKVYCYMSHYDYYLDSDKATVNYTVNRATVEYLEFDTSSLSNQIYGSVSVPTVTTSPANISYIVSFPGYEYMPTNAGTYSIKVVINDSNYEPSDKSSMFRISPKDITIEGITVTNRAVDGTAAVAVSGTLQGIMVGDEVYLNMTAKTANDETTPGTYGVTILTYELSGLHAGNYNVLAPVYSLNVKLKAKAVYDGNTSSYITSNNGLSENVTVEFNAVSDTQNATTWFSSMFGQDATTQVFTIKENGLETQLAEKVKVYVKIPDKYLGNENIQVEALGDLANNSVTFTREGDYITFYTDSSGEIVIYTKDFPYWIIIVIAVAAMLLIGIICVFVFFPDKRRLKVSRGVRRMHKKQQKEEERRLAELQDQGGVTVKIWGKGGKY